MEHRLHPHSHDWQPPRYRRCSGWFWCLSHERWEEGGKCELPGEDAPQEEKAQKKNRGMR